LLVWICGCEDPSEPQPARYELGLELGEDEGALMSVWGSGPERIFAVGGQPEAAGETGILYSFDGSNWEAEALPDGTPMLNWVYGAGDDVWLVGNLGTAMRGQPGGWSATDTGSDQPLWGVWGGTGDDLWAVGGDPFGDEPVLLHWDGQAWSSETIPDLDRDCASLFKVWGTAGDNVYAVGDAGVILHWQGDGWEQELSGTGSDLISLWGTGPDDIVVAGGRSNGTLARWDGESWTSQTLAGIAGLNGVWVDAAGEATVVGALGAVAVLAPGSFEFEFEDNPAGNQVLHAVFGLEDGSRVAVGGNLLDSPPWEGVLIQKLP
jgi:hypothetical protein